MLISDDEAFEAVIRLYSKLPPAGCAFMALDIASSLTPAQRTALLRLGPLGGPRLRRVNARSLIVLCRNGLISRRTEDGAFEVSPLGEAVLAVSQHGRIARVVKARRGSSAGPAKRRK
jgi:hypothetical protein